MIEKSDVAKREEEVLEFWKRERIFEKSLEKPAPKGEFVFYDGPPFATGLPHSGSLLSSVSKDLVPRYKTMRGYRVRRRWGWDTHGLPIESIVEKKLGLKNKKEIIAFGVEKFNEIARSTVLEYVGDWKRYVDRVGRWVDFDNSYKTMDNSFIESVWWALKEIYKKGNLYEGKKVLMYCTHCETPLAKAEIAMDNTYKDITEEAITIKFKLRNPEKLGLFGNVFLLAWTTTPWTLPGNVALAVGENITYDVSDENGEILIQAKENGRFRGSDLVGLSYVPLYEIPDINKQDKCYKVYAADFVATDEGTGVVHIAVMYGEDDYMLGVREGLPMVQLLNQNGTYIDSAPAFIRGEYIKKAEKKIKDDLSTRGLLKSLLPHTHSYPHCYRCDTPLIYNAVTSWFINIQNIKSRMLVENNKINWFPKHLKEGRFKKIIENAPDWTISRNRFWASPLPIWKDAKGDVIVIGSLEELKKHTKKSGNTYYVMRHGEAENNVQGIVSGSEQVELKHALTQKGRKSVEVSSEQLKRSGGVDIIIASPFVRTRETAYIVADQCNIARENIIFDSRIREIYTGEEFDGKPVENYISFYSSYEERLTKAPKGGETFTDLARRAGELLYEIEAKFQGKRIIIISHEDIIRALSYVSTGNFKRAFSPVPNATIRTLDFVPLPHNRNFILDYHLPYIDKIQLLNQNNEPMQRIPEVVDCWVESGSMPFAEYHYPFENNEEFERRSPGDFVSEYIGQTRAWFYYLHAMSISLFGRKAFRHAITTGNILAADGAKLSKSKGNYTDPYDLFNRYGADAFRYYLMSSAVMRAEDIMFRDEEVREIQQRVVNILRNIGTFYKLFKDDAVTARNRSDNVLDRWILARLNSVILTVTEALDRCDVPHASRPMHEFIDDFSTWYVRRSRERIRGEHSDDREEALAILRHVLKEFSKIIAPVMPFIAEELFQLTKEQSDSESVHLAEWPVAKNKWRLFGDSDDVIIADMSKIRILASEALQLRQTAGIKVRQPLSRFTISDRTLEGKKELLQILKEEINVKEINFGTMHTLDTALTPELIKEGDEREFARAVAEARKSENFLPRDNVEVIMDEGNHSAILSSGIKKFSLKKVKSGEQ